MKAVKFFGKGFLVYYIFSALTFQFLMRWVAWGEKKKIKLEGEEATAAGATLLFPLVWPFVLFSNDEGTHY